MDIHEDAFNGGAPYPDAFYDDICFKGSSCSFVSKVSCGYLKLLFSYSSLWWFLSTFPEHEISLIF